MARLRVDTDELRTGARLINQRSGSIDGLIAGVSRARGAAQFDWKDTRLRSVNVDGRHTAVLNGLRTVQADLDSDAQTYRRIADQVDGMERAGAGHHLGVSGHGSWVDLGGLAAGTGAALAAIKALFNKQGARTKKPFNPMSWLRARGKDLQKLLKGATAFVTHGVFMTGLKLGSFAGHVWRAISRRVSETLRLIRQGLTRVQARFAALSALIWSPRPKRHPAFRPSEFSPGDVKQQDIGDCYLMAALAALANTNRGRLRLSEMIAYDPETRTYIVTFESIDGKRRVVRIKESDLRKDMPFRGFDPISGRKKAFAGAHNSDKWLRVLELAYSQAIGFDSMNDGGTAAQVYKDMFGAKSTFIPSSHYSSELYRQLRMEIENGKAVTAQTPSFKKGDPRLSSFPRQYGVWPNHAYTVLAAEYINGHMCVRLRNPWGEGEPGEDGKWWGGSNFDGNSDGSFTMTIEEYQRVFVLATVSDV